MLKNNITANEIVPVVLPSGCDGALPLAPLPHAADDLLQTGSNNGDRTVVVVCLLVGAIIFQTLRRAETPIRIPLLHKLFCGSTVLSNAELNMVRAVRHSLVLRQAITPGQRFNEAVITARHVAYGQYLQS